MKETLTTLTCDNCGTTSTIGAASDWRQIEPIGFHIIIEGINQQPFGGHFCSYHCLAAFASKHTAN